MTVINEQGRKILLPRAGLEELWYRIEAAFAQDDPRLWRYLAMFALREAAGWSIEQISLSLGHSPGHVSRCLRTVRQDLRRRFARDLRSTEAFDCLCDADGEEDAMSLRDLVGEGGEDE